MISGLQVEQFELEGEGLRVLERVEEEEDQQGGASGDHAAVRIPEE